MNRGRRTTTALRRRTSVRSLRAAHMIALGPSAMLMLSAASRLGAASGGGLELLSGSTEDGVQ